jgi:hypothetical protein
VTKKEEPRICRPEDALIFLDKALKAPSGSFLRQQYLDGALMTYGFGLVNERRYKTRGDRRGRPKGWRGQWVDDGEALKIMSVSIRNWAVESRYTNLQGWWLAAAACR